jgi:hypothetical protein
MDGNELAFRAEPTTQQGVEIRVNFGVFAGREATHAEIDDLARELFGLVNRVSIVSLRRHELDREGEAAIHQVKIEADASDAVRPSGADELAASLLETCESWARRCIEIRHAEVAEVEALP